MLAAVLDFWFCSAGGVGWGGGCAHCDEMHAPAMVNGALELGMVPKVRVLKTQASLELSAAPGGLSPLHLARTASFKEFS